MIYNQYPYQSIFPAGATKLKVVLHGTALSSLPVDVSVTAAEELTSIPQYEVTLSNVPIESAFSKLKNQLSAAESKALADQRAAEILAKRNAISTATITDVVKVVDGVIVFGLPISDTPKTIATIGEISLGVNFLDVYPNASIVSSAITSYVNYISREFKVVIAGVDLLGDGTQYLSKVTLNLYTMKVGDITLLDTGYSIRVMETASVGVSGIMPFDVFADDFIAFVFDY